MKKTLKYCGSATIVALAMAASSAHADENVVFNGLVLDTCTVVLDQAIGTLGASSDGTTLSSSELGGVPAVAAVLTTNTNYVFQLDTPAGFTTAPAGGDTNAVLTADYTATGVSVGAALSGVDLDLGLGATIVQIDLDATKSDSSVFPAGSYAADLTLRCITSGA